jgi:hypothetical protein
MMPEIRRAISTRARECLLELQRLVAGFARLSRVRSGEERG